MHGRDLVAMGALGEALCGGLIGLLFFARCSACSWGWPAAG
jgi:hypothetical protein